MVTRQFGDLFGLSRIGGLASALPATRPKGAGGSGLEAPVVFDFLQSRAQRGESERAHLIILEALRACAAMHRGCEFAAKRQIETRMPC
jgi:hypothetical protein